MINVRPGRRHQVERSPRDSRCSRSVAPVHASLRSSRIATLAAPRAAITRIVRAVRARRCATARAATTEDRDASAVPQNRAASTRPTLAPGDRTGVSHSCARRLAIEDAAMTRATPSACAARSRADRPGQAPAGHHDVAGDGIGAAQPETAGAFGFVTVRRTSLVQASRDDARGVGPQREPLGREHDGKQSAPGANGDRGRGTEQAQGPRACPRGRVDRHARKRRRGGSSDAVLTDGFVAAAGALRRRCCRAHEEPGPRPRVAPERTAVTAEGQRRRCREPARGAIEPAWLHADAAEVDVHTGARGYPGRELGDGGLAAGDAGAHDAHAAHDDR